MISGWAKNLLGDRDAGGRRLSVRRRSASRRKPQPEEERALQSSIRWHASKRKAQDDEPAERRPVRWVGKPRHPGEPLESEPAPASAVRWLARSRRPVETPEGEPDVRTDIRWVAGKRHAWRKGVGKVQIAMIALVLAVSLGGSVALKVLLMGNDPAMLATGAFTKVSSRLTGGDEPSSAKELSAKYPPLPPRYPAIPPQGPRDPGASRPGASSAGPQAKGKVVVEMPEGNANGVKRAKGEKGLSAGGKVGKGKASLSPKAVRGSKREAKGGEAVQGEARLAGEKGGMAVKPGRAVAQADPSLALGADTEAGPPAAPGGMESAFEAGEPPPSAQADNPVAPDAQVVPKDAGKYGANDSEWDAAEAPLAIAALAPSNAAEQAPVAAEAGDFAALEAPAEAGPSADAGAEGSASDAGAEPPPAAELSQATSEEGIKPGEAAEETIGEGLS